MISLHKNKKVYKILFSNGVNKYTIETEDGYVTSVSTDNPVKLYLDRLADGWIKTDLNDSPPKKLGKAKGKQEGIRSIVKIVDDKLYLSSKKIPVDDELLTFMKLLPSESIEIIYHDGMYKFFKYHEIYKYYLELFPKTKICCC